MKKTITALLLLLAPMLAHAQTTNFPSRNGQTVATVASPNCDFSKADACKILLTGNVAAATMSGAEAGQFVSIETCQDATGGRTYVPPAQWQGFQTIASTALACTLNVGRYNGTNVTDPTTGSGGGGSGTVNSATINQIAKYPGSGTTVGGSTVFTEDGTTLTYSGVGGVSSPKVSATGAGAGGIILTAGAVPTCTDATKGVVANDSISNSVQLCNHGTSTYQSLATNFSTSPTTFGVAIGAGFPAFSTTSAGVAGQPFISCGPTCAGGFGNLDLSTGFFANRLPKANVPSTTVFNDQANTYSTGLQDFGAASLKLPISAGLTLTTNGLCGYDSTSNNYHCGLNGADSRLVNFTTPPANNDCPKWVVTGGNALLGTTGAPCGGGGASRWDQITAATTGATTDNADNAIIYRTASTTSSRIGWRNTESAASIAGGTPFLFQIDTLSSSTANPFQVCSGGTANCWRWDTAALMKPIGAAALAIPGSAKGVVVSQGPSAAATTVTGALNQLMSFDAGGNPIAADPIISLAFVNIWTAQDVTVTRTSAAVRNPLFSQTGTLQLTWASITGSPATCTLQIQGVDSVGNALNNGSTFSVSPANGTTSQTFTAAASLQSAAQIKAIFACVTYPTTGTLTLDFTPVPNVNVTNTVSDNLAQVAGAATDTNSGTKSAGTLRVVLATDQPQLTNKLLVTPDPNSAVNVAQVAGTNTDTNSGTKSAGTLRVVLATDQPQLTNKLLVTPDSVALPANQSVNVNQLAGTNTDTNSGTKSAGTLRVVLATDQPALTNKLLVTPDSVALPANQSVNTSQINGVTPLMGNGVTGTGSQRVTIASDQTAYAVNATDIGTLADNGATAATNRVATLPAIARSNLPANATAGRDVAPNTDLSRNLLVAMMPNTSIPTFTANKLALASAASATDIAVLPGNATNTVIVTRVQVSCTQTTAGIVDLQLIQRTTADTGGTSGAMTAVKMDTGNSAAVSAPLTYTANPTINSTVGNYDSVKLGCMAPATASPADIYVWKPGIGQSIILRGTAQQLAVNLNGVTVTGGSFNITFSWIETTGL